MSDYLVTGKKGVGKTLFAVGIIHEALAAGKRVATNIDIHLDRLCSPKSRMTLVRVPDHPSVEDFEALGRGQEGIPEENNGVIVLDESSAFLNARDWNNKGRASVLEWIIHSRKYGWDTYLLCQGPSQIDKQVRETQIEYHCIVKRTDKWPIPIITPLASMIGIKVTFPKMHFGVIKYGMSPDALVIERRWYKSKRYYDAYDTRQIFLPQDHPEAVRMHSLLSAWHVVGRYQRPSILVRAWVLFRDFARGLLLGPRPRRRSTGVQLLLPDILTPDQKWAVARTLAGLEHDRARRVYIALIARLRNQSFTPQSTT